MIRKFFAIITIITSLFTLGACGDSPEKFYTLDTKITCVTIEDGARIRANPFVPGPDQSPNDLLVIEMKDYKSFSSSPASFTVQTPKGVASASDNNGVWYGINRDDFVGALAGDLAKEFGEGDELVWVNESKSQSSCS